jgi:hypothetical protein
MNRERNQEKIDQVPQMENGKWQMENGKSKVLCSVTGSLCSKAVCRLLPEGPRFRRPVAENA